MEKHFRIRDLRNGSWFWVNTAVLRCVHIDTFDKAVYGALATFAGCDEIRPSYKIIAERCAVSERRAKKSIKNLVAKGLVSIVKGGGRGKANVYELPKATKGCLLCTVSEPERVHEMSEKGAQYDRKRVHNVHTNKISELNKEKDTKISDAGVAVNDILSSFKELSDRPYFANKTQRGAVERILKIYTPSAIKKAIAYAAAIRGSPYAPVITTPLQLEEKFRALIDHKKRTLDEESKNKPKVIVIK